jgi:hypothetical protein
MVCYALSTPGSATVTLKCLDSKGTVTVVQVSCAYRTRLTQ